MRGRGGRNTDPEFVRLRGAIRVDDPAKKAEARRALEEYKRKLRVAEAKAIIAEERRRVLVAAGLNGNGEERAS